ncbi:hypothetical protein FAGKG844_250042 [Frankia sp. AgKG'84/4]
MIRTYRRCPEFAWGTSTVLDCGVPSVLAHHADLDGQTIIAVHNLRREVAEIHLSRTDVERGDRLVGLTGSNECRRRPGRRRRQSRRLRFPPATSSPQRDERIGAAGPSADRTPRRTARR